MRTRLSSDKIELFSYFFLLSVVGSLLLSCPWAYASAHPVPYIDALFTSVSAVCVTGLSTVSMDVYSRAGFVVIMFLIEFGGLGIITFASLYILAPRKKISLVNRAVIRDFFIDDVETNPRSILVSIIAFTVSIEILCAVVLFFQFRAEGSADPALNAAFTSVSAFCNAGFSMFDSSLWDFRSNLVILGTVMVLIVTGGIGFTVLTDILSRARGRTERLSFHSRIVLIVTAFLILSGAALVFALNYSGALSTLTLPEKLFASLFQSVTPRTAGFQVVAQQDFTPLTRLMTLVFMFVGGSPGSIAGGIKTTTFCIVVLYAIRGNSGREGLNMRGRNVDTATVEKAFSICAKSMMIVFASLSLLLLTEQPRLDSGGITIFELLFEVVSAFGTVGLSLGATLTLSVFGKIVVIITMLCGRLGVFAMAIGFARNERERHFEYPSASVMVG